MSSVKEEKNICPVAAYCGGCDMQGISYEDQCARKQERMKVLFQKLIVPKEIKKAEEPLHYRNKVQFSFGKDEKGRTVLGNYAKDSHFLIPIQDCMICDETAVKIALSICRIVNRYKISVFDERSMKGCMRHLLLRITSSGDVMVVLVTGSPRILHEEELVRDIRKYNPEVKTVIHNINNRHTSMILGERYRTLYGSGYITDHLLGKDFRISPSSFYQVNKTQTPVLYQTAIEYAGLSGRERVLDAYCGTGTIGILMADKAREVVGVEINASAVKDANINASANHIRNISFLCEDAGKYMRQAAEKKERFDVVLMDPPRSGSDETFLRSLCQLSPEKIVYISCGPDTLRRDLSYLNKKGYKIEKLQPVDMFPYTDHVESICLMSKK